MDSSIQLTQLGEGAQGRGRSGAARHLRAQRRGHGRDDGAAVGRADPAGHARAARRADQSGNEHGRAASTAATSSLYGQATQYALTGGLTTAGTMLAQGNFSWDLLAKGITSSALGADGQHLNTALPRVGDPPRASSPYSDPPPPSSPNGPNHAPNHAPDAAAASTSPGPARSADPAVDPGAVPSSALSPDPSPGARMTDAGSWHLAEPDAPRPGHRPSGPGRASRPRRHSRRDEGASRTGSGWDTRPRAGARRRRGTVAAPPATRSNPRLRPRASPAPPRPGAPPSRRPMVARGGRATCRPAARRAVTRRCRRRERGAVRAVRQYVRGRSASRPP